MADPILDLKDVSFSINNRPVLKDISMRVNKGDYLAIIGPNGSGKTTLVRISLGLLRPSKGSIRLFGQNINSFHEWEKIGYIPQKATNFDHHFPASVREIVGIQKSGRSSEKIQSLLKKVGIEHLAERRIGELSGGQQQRMFIAKSLVTDPLLLILDEPVAGIDTKGQEDFYAMLSKLHKEGTTIIIVTHDVGFITKHVSKVACVNQRLIFHGTHQEFCSTPVVDKTLGHDKHILCHTHAT